MRPAHRLRDSLARAAFRDGWPAAASLHQLSSCNLWKIPSPTPAGREVSRMLGVPCFFRRSAVALLLAGGLLIPLRMAAQTAQAGTGQGTTLPPDAQANINKLQAELEAARTAGDRGAEAKSLKLIFLAYSHLGEKQKALDYCNQALPILRRLGDKTEEAWTLNFIGILYNGLWDWQKALDYYTQALTLRREIGDRDGEGMALANIGAVYENLSDMHKALECQQQALLIFREVHDRPSEGFSLGAIGRDYRILGDPQKALEYYSQALPFERQFGTPGDQAVLLNNIAIANSVLGEKQKALEFFMQALPIFHQLGQRDREAATLDNIGSTYMELGDEHKALDYCNQSLPAYRDAGDRAGEARALNNIGNAYYWLGDMAKAAEYYTQSLPIAREAGNWAGVASTLNNIGSVYTNLKQQQKALEFFEQAVTVARQQGDRDDEGMALDNAGATNWKLGEMQKALDDLSQALSIATALGDPLQQADVLNNLLVAQKDLEPSLAIFYGKQAVNLTQQVRGNIRGLDKSLQRSFLASKTDYYHNLADLLITHNRLPEAEQVLDLLKQQEYSDYTRGAAAGTLSPITLTPAEQQAEEDYQKSTTQLVSMGKEFDDLSKENPRSPDDEKKFQDLKTRLDAASAGLSSYYDRLHVLFAKSGEFNKQKAEIKGDVRALQNAIADSPRTVGLYTMVTADRYRVIVITPSVVPVAREYAISEADLNRKVAALDQLLQDPASDPRPLAQELYNILVGPVKADLDQAHAETLVWSLDGALRYLPLAALYDGKKYLVESLSNVTITPASFGLLSQKPDVSKLSVVAMGISRQYEEHLPALPAVVGELNDVVTDPKVQAAHGVLPGTILLNEQFTQKAMEDALNGRYKVVHIASHFVFQPGDDSKSYLLLASNDNAAQGHHLTVEDFSNDPSLKLDSTDLLTLSACQTGMSGEASNGREVDGLGMTAQYNGAKAVISSLWSVNDASTGQLMSDFYRRWAAGGGTVSKVEALRQAQLDLLHGNTSGNGSSSGRGFNVAAKVSPLAIGFTHPYYWAPFVLMGNWQ
jgi:CHAT domain-containing protein